MIRLITIAIGVFAAVGTMRVALAQEANTATGATLFTDEERASIRAEVLAAILDYPEIIEEAQAILEARQANEALASVLRDPNTPILGNPDGGVTLIEFFDYNCGYCRRMADPLRDLLADEEDLRVIMIEVPILSQESYEAAQVSLGVKVLGGDYATVHFDAMTANGRTSGESVLSAAEDQGINMDVLRAIVSSDSISETISRNYDAMQALDISGTPAFIVAGSGNGNGLIDINIMRGAVPVEELRAAMEMTRVGS